LQLLVGPTTPRIPPSTGCNIASISPYLSRSNGHYFPIFQEEVCSYFIFYKFNLFQFFGKTINPVLFADGRSFNLCVFILLLNFERLPWFEPVLPGLPRHDPGGDGDGLITPFDYACHVSAATGTPLPIADAHRTGRGRSKGLHMAMMLLG